MKLNEVMDALTQHREHYRVLPEKVQLALGGLIKQIEEAIDAENAPKPEVAADVVAEGAEKDTKVPKRSYRKRVE